MDRNRPYDGQEHTDHGERGKTEIRGITFRDLRDCYVRACCQSAGAGLSKAGDILYEESEKGVDANLSESDVFDLPWDQMDPIAVAQNLTCEVEKIMGIYPNIPDFSLIDKKDILEGIPVVGTIVDHGDDSDHYRQIGEDDPRDGYVVRLEERRMSLEDDWFQMFCAYSTIDGGYIGREEDAVHLCEELGIAPQKNSVHHNVCSIGFCEKEQKWYGWSHRALYGFGIGEVVKEGDSTAESGWIDGVLPDGTTDILPCPVGFEAKTLDDAKRMAVAFASSVG